MLDGKVLDPRLRAFTNALSADFGEDIDGWTELVGMNVTQTTTATWTDEDHQRYLVNLTELAGTFRRLEAINYDHLAETGDSADAVRVTLTRPDGSETARMVWLDAATRGTVDKYAGEAIDALASILGSKARARESLIAWAAGQDLEGHEASVDQIEAAPRAASTTTRREGNA